MILVTNKMHFSYTAVEYSSQKGAAKKPTKLETT